MATTDIMNAGWTPSMNDRFAKLGLADLGINPADLCIGSSIALKPLCVSFPGGAEVCISPGDMLGLPNMGEMAGQMLGKVNTALAPMIPLFNIIDAVVAVIECIKGVPDAITSLSPKPIMDCLEKLLPIANKLLQMLPIMTIPKMVIQIIDILIAALIGIREEIIGLVDIQARISFASSEAARTNNVHLGAIVDCKKGEFDLYVGFVNSRLSPINRMLTILAQLVSLAGIELPIGCLTIQTGGTLPVAFLLTPIDAAIYLLYSIRALVPGFVFPMFGDPDDGGCPPDKAMNIGGPAPGPQDAATLRRNLEAMIPGLNLKELGYG